MFNKITKKLRYLSFVPLAIYAPNAFSYLLGANIEIKNNTNFDIFFNLNAPNVHCEARFHGTPGKGAGAGLRTVYPGGGTTIAAKNSVTMCADNFDHSGELYSTSKASYKIFPLINMNFELASGGFEFYTGPTLWNMAAYFTNEKIIENDSYSISLKSTPKWENSEWVSAGSIVNLSLEINGKKLK